MASCYHCGKSGADYRRTVTTGFSRSSWVSKRSYGSGSSTSYGLRTLCENCAFQNDKSKSRSSAIWAIVIFCFLILFIFIKK
jgi:hypothetical protein